MPSKRLSTTEAARIIAERSGYPIDPRNVRDLCVGGTLPATKQDTPRGPVWLIRQADAEHYGDQRRPQRTSAARNVSESAGAGEEVSE